MKFKMIEKLEYVPIREIWKHEAYDFTNWLYDNMDVLNEQVGLSINPIEKEKSVGPFYVDLLGEDLSGKVVIIENQLTRTDHDHLGKLLTYMSNLDAKTAIWITTDPRPEHITAINYLNENIPPDTQIFLLRLQAIRIGNSAPAPLFTVESGPSEERKVGGKVKKELAEHDKKRYAFFEQFLIKANQVTDIFYNVSPLGYQNWITAGAGKAGIMWTVVLMKKTSRVEFFLCHSDPKVNTTRFQKLHSEKNIIEEKFGEPLEWDFNESRKQQYIKSICIIGGLDDNKKWDDIIKDLINRIIRLKNVINPYIQSL